MEHLYKDVFISLKQSLRPIDLYNLAQTCKKYQKQITLMDIKKSVIFEINNRLREIFGEHFEGFKSSLRNSNAKIVKSFVTQCMLGEHWDNNIDIHIRENELYNSFDQIDILCFVDTDKIKTVNCLSLIDNNYKMDGLFENNEWSIHLITYRIGNTNIYVKKEIDYEYDIDRNVYFYDGMDENIYIHKINGIFTKRTNFYESENMHLKYKLRGFSFYNDDGIVISNDALWKKLNINIVKVTPDSNKSTKKRRKILVKNKYNYQCSENIIYHNMGQLCDKKLYHLPTQLRRFHTQSIMSCIGGAKSPCLFENIYPGTEHLHCSNDKKYIHCSDDKKYIFVVDADNLIS